MDQPIDAAQGHGPDAAQEQQPRQLQDGRLLRRRGGRGRICLSGGRWRRVAPVLVPLRRRSGLLFHNGQKTDRGRRLGRLFRGWFRRRGVRWRRGDCGCRRPLCFGLCFGRRGRRRRDGRGRVWRGHTGGRSRRGRQGCRDGQGDRHRSGRDGGRVGRRRDRRRGGSGGPGGIGCGCRLGRRIFCGRRLGRIGELKNRRDGVRRLRRSVRGAKGCWSGGGCRPRRRPCGGRGLNGRLDRCRRGGFGGGRGDGGAHRWRRLGLGRRGNRRGGVARLSF